MKKFFRLLPLVAVLSIGWTSTAEAASGCRVPVQGPPGINGTTGGFVHLYADAIGGAISLTVSPGRPVVFTAVPINSGAAIFYDGAGTFTFSESGDYLVQFIGQAVNSSSGFQVYINGTAVGPTTPITLLAVAAAVPAVLSEIVTIPAAGSTLQVRNSGLQTLTLGVLGTAATIDMVQLSTP
jgi:hypothetical protein